MCYSPVCSNPCVSPCCAAPSQLPDWLGAKGDFTQPAQILTAQLYLSDVWHSGGANRSQARERDMLQVHYGRRMVAQKFSPYLNWRFNPQVLEEATPRQRRLLGEHEEAEYD